MTGDGVLTCMGCPAEFLIRDSVEETKAAMLSQGWGWYDGSYVGSKVKMLYCPDCRHRPKPRISAAKPLDDQTNLF
jgi:hypothetical protein